MEFNVDEIKNSEQAGISNSASIRSSMDLDMWSAQSTSTLTTMTSAVGGIYERSTTSPMHSSTGVSQSNGITFKPLERQARRNPSRSLRIPQATYNMIEQGNTIEVYDKHFDDIHAQRHQGKSDRSRRKHKRMCHKHATTQTIEEAITIELRLSTQLFAQTLLLDKERFISSSVLHMASGVKPRRWVPLERNVLLIGSDIKGVVDGTCSSEPDHFCFLFADLIITY
ncbi:hypothetical protein Cgig2_016367 [Carnegiea gigantea]|uniref:Uncharacterized protein n=1 Tax=Carnegiea gigantea TaxID=171969 RepID=A0A9Q1JX48_9CARY|nr:hypothetical protein Cgig2_016367 [Carnegiea gigantea]